MNSDHAVVKQHIADNGFAVIEDVFTAEQVDRLISIIDSATHNNSNFRKDKELFAIRDLLGEIPALNQALWSSGFNRLIDELFGPEYFAVKAIYFDKPAMSNWLVTWHQDTTISVNDRKDIEGFGPWTLKGGAHAVQPTKQVLDNIYTVRIHLDDCNETNGALKVVPGSHNMDMLTAAEIIQLDKPATTCSVCKGGVMIMRPLLLHASGKSTADTNRRVIHLEFASMQLPQDLQWREYVARRQHV